MYIFNSENKRKYECEGREMKKKEKSHSMARLIYFTLEGEYGGSSFKLSSPSVENPAAL